MPARRTVEVSQPGETPPALAILGGTVVTMDSARTVDLRDIIVSSDGRISDLPAAGGGGYLPAQRTIDASQRVVVPGLIQAHLHLCQTLFRGLAEQLPLLDYLRERIWPLEAAHDPASLRASARLGMAELLLGGTTSVLDMGTVHHTDTLFETAAEMGLRYTGGKALMDTGDGVPPGLLEATAIALRESDRLAGQWHECENGRLRYAYAPRFVLTASYDLLRSVAARARANHMLVHTHASEQREEADLVRQRFRTSNITLLANLGLAETNACIAHCVWPEPDEIGVLASGGASVVHCPSCNLKLSSGVAPIADYLEQGVNVAIGADGAASNNRLDAWSELRLAGLLAAYRSGAAAVPAFDLFEMATVGGARALGLDAVTGSIEVGKYADLAILDVRRAHTLGAPDIYTQLVYSAGAEDVRTVLVGGRVVVDEGHLVVASETEIIDDAERERESLLQRAKLDLVFD
jgi:5-methylthioadenosine/S-adenosylhomocysteine deaminase